MLLQKPQVVTEEILILKAQNASLSHQLKTLCSSLSTFTSTPDKRKPLLLDVGSELLSGLVHQLRMLKDVMKEEIVTYGDIPFNQC